jgi:hypothetical protein
VRSEEKFSPRRSHETLRSKWCKIESNAEEFGSEKKKNRGAKPKKHFCVCCSPLLNSKQYYRAQIFISQCTVATAKALAVCSATASSMQRQLDMCTHPARSCRSCCLCWAGPMPAPTSCLSALHASSQPVPVTHRACARGSRRRRLFLLRARLLLQCRGMRSTQNQRDNHRYVKPRHLCLSFLLWMWMWSYQIILPDYR